MKRQKQLGILIGVLAALCVVIFLVSRVERHIDSISTISEEIVSADPDALTQVSWTLDGNSLTFTQTDGVWQEESDAAFPVDQDKMSEFLGHFESVIASFIIEDVEDFGQYGLDNPGCTVTLPTADGDTVIELGDYSTMDSKRYLTLGDGTVYLIDDDLQEYVSTDRDDFMRQDTVPEYDTLDSIAVSGGSSFTVEHHPDEGLSYSEEYEYFLVDAEGSRALSTDKVTGLVSTFDSLDRTNYATYTATEDDLAQYGLDSPAASFTVASTLDDEQSSFTLAFGQADEENCYMRMDDSPIIYQIDAESYADIVATGYDTLRPDEILALDWELVESLDVTIDGETYTIEHGETDTVNGEEVDLSDVMDAIDALEVSEFNSETPSKKEEIAFAVHLDSEDFPSLTIALYQYDGENCLAQLDGETLGLVSRSLAVDVVEAVNAITLGLA